MFFEAIKSCVDEFLVSRGFISIERISKIYSLQLWYSRPGFSLNQLREVILLKRKFTGPGEFKEAFSY